MALIDDIIIIPTISTAEQLEMIRDNMSGTYCLGADIDMQGIDFIPLGATTNQSSYSTIVPFTGTLDGCGHTIKNLTISRNTTNTYNFVGLFANLDGIVKNLVIKDAEINVTGYNPCVGILAGEIYNSATSTANVTKVSVSGNINVVHNSVYTDYAFRAVGGFIGSVYVYNNYGYCTDCISKVNINITGTTKTLYVGGFIGYGDGVILKRCYAFGNINVLNTADTYLKISGMQPLCYQSKHTNCACAVNITGATADTVSECCDYVTATSSFTNTNSRYVWTGRSISWESYDSTSDIDFTEENMSVIIGTDYTQEYNISDLDFANGKYLKLNIENESVSYDIVINNTTYSGVKKIIYNGTEISKLVIGTNEYIFGN